MYARMLVGVQKISILLLTISLSIVLGFSTASAHKTVNIDNLAIEVGWQQEPPLIGFMNAITFGINEKAPDGNSGVKNAFKNLVATIKSGGLTKTLDIDSEPQAGHYNAKIIPTSKGSYIVLLKGDVNGVKVDTEVPVEDVEDQSILAFPTKQGSSEQDTGAIKNAMSGLQNEVGDLKAKISGISTTKGSDIENAYNFGILGLSLGAAGIILAIVAMIKRK